MKNFLIKPNVNIKNALTSARKLALKLRHSYVSCEHLFYTFLKTQHCPAIEFFEALGNNDEKTKYYRKKFSSIMFT